MLVKIVFILWILTSFRFFHKFFSMLIVCIGHHIRKKLTGWPFMFGLANHGLVRFGLYLDFQIFLNVSLSLIYEESVYWAPHCKKVKGGL